MAAIRLKNVIVCGLQQYAYREGVGYEFNSGEIAAISEYIQEFGDPDPGWTRLTVTLLSVKK